MQGDDGGAAGTGTRPTEDRGRTGPIGPVATLAQLLRSAGVRWSASSQLRVSLIRWSALGLILSAAAGASAGALGGRVAVGLVLDLVWWALTSACLFAGLSLLRTYPAGTPVQRLGLPNGITAIRAYLSVPVVLFAALPPLSLARVLFLAIASPIAVLDAADGFIARRGGLVTVLGRALDPIMDTVFFSLCAIASLIVGFVPPWLALLVVARYGLPGLGFVLLYPWLRRRPALVATWFGKVNTMAGAVTLGLSAILVLAGGPVQQVDLGLGALLAVTAIGHFVTLWRRTFRPPAPAGS